MARKLGIPLLEVPQFSMNATGRLADLWITTAEELASAAYQTGGRASLANFLHTSISDVDSLVAKAKAVLPEGDSYDEENIDVALGAMPVENVPSAKDEPLAFNDLPSKVDLRPQMPPVRHQGDRGTCVAHAAVAVREYLIGARSTDADLSEQYLYWACKQRDGWSGEGTWIKYAMAVLKEMGTCPEQIWPYNKYLVKNNEGQGEPPTAAAEEAKAFRITSYRELTATYVTTDLKAALARGNPVAFSVFVYESCQRPYTYRVADLRLPLPAEREIGSHAMCAVGYVDDDEVRGGGYFVVRNSWGENFGHDGEIAPGYCRLPYEYLRLYGQEAYEAFVD